MRRSSVRASLRSQPFWTKVSLPSGRISVIVAWRSTFGTEALIHVYTAPGPTTVFAAPSGPLT